MRYGQRLDAEVVKLTKELDCMKAKAKRKRKAKRKKNNELSVAPPPPPPPHATEPKRIRRSLRLATPQKLKDFKGFLKEIGWVDLDWSNADAIAASKKKCRRMWAEIKAKKGLKIVGLSISWKSPGQPVQYNFQRPGIKNTSTPASIKSLDEFVCQEEFLEFWK